MKENETENNINGSVMKYQYRNENGENIETESERKSKKYRQQLSW
jgi:hypothetical protein